MDVESQRLFIQPISIEQAHKLMVDAEGYPEWLGVPYDALWPGDGLKALLPVYGEALEKDKKEYGFGPWIMVDKHKQMVIGDIGFKGAPINGIVEIGYYVSTIHRNQGYAKEAGEALLQWAFSHEDVTIVTASCHPSNIPSCRVLESCGFIKSREEDGVIWFENRKERSYGKDCTL